MMARTHLSPIGHFPRASLGFLSATLILACGSQGEPGGSSGDGGAPTSSTTGGSSAGSGAAPGVSTGGAAPQPGTGGSGVGGTSTEPVPGTLAPPQFVDQDAPSDGGTITFTEIGKAGSYLSRRAPDSGQCDGYSQDQCCMTTVQEESNALTPWDKDLIMTLRGPLLVKQVAAYQTADPNAATWPLVSVWDDRKPSENSGVAFRGDGESAGTFSGTVGSSCILDVMTDSPFACGIDGFCEQNMPDRLGWAGSKMLVVLAKMPDHGEIADAQHCTTDPGQNWYNAPWIGLSSGELIRTNKFGSCNCYGSTPPAWYDGEGCGQFNVFEVVNDNNDFQNFDLFSTNFFAYHGYVGGGPCGKGCDLSALPGSVDLVDKANSQAAQTGVSVSAESGSSNPGVAFVRPWQGYRYFVVLFDVKTRNVQLALLHPDKIPLAAQTVLPTFPGSMPRETVDALLNLRLPQ